MMPRIKLGSPEWHALYRLFLASPAWPKKKALVLKRANHVCECCLEARAITAHHSHYPPILTLDALTHQPLWALKAICERCHDMFDGTTFMGTRK